MRQVRTLLKITLLLFCAILSSRAQNSRGSILGHVQDPSGAVVANATVTLRNVGTNIRSSFVTNSEGDYVFVNLIPGSYELTVKGTGFKTAVSPGLILQVDQKLRQDFSLQLGQVSESVTVSAQTQMMQTDSMTVGQVISERYVNELPLNGRDFTSLIALSAGVTQAAGGIQTSVFDQHGLNDSFRMMSVDGARPSSIGFMVDGVSSSDYFFAKSTASPPPDAIEEFKLQNGMYSAEYGDGSAQVNVAIKSGKNAFHGSLYDFLRNDAFQPDSPVIQALNKMNGTSSATKTPFKQNQFGGTISGPVRLPHLYNGKDRTFFFFNYEAGRRRITSGPVFAQVPTAKERGGDFSDWPYPIYDPATTGSVAPTATDPTGRTPFPGNIIPAGRLSSIAKNWLAYFPQPNVICTMSCLNYAGTPLKTPTDTNNYIGRLDHRFTAADSISVTATAGDNTVTNPTTFPASSTAAYSITKMFAINYDHVFSPNAVNEFRMGYNRELYHNGALTAFGPDLSRALGFAYSATQPQYYGLPVLSISNGFGAPGTANNGYTQKDNIFQYVDNFKLTRGKQTMTMGAEIKRVRLWDADGFTTNGRLTFTGSYTASNPAVAGRTGPYGGNGLADFMLGYPITTGPPSPLGSDYYDVRGTYWAMFFQDDYRITPRLTLNLGMRYEIAATLHSTNNSGAVINLQNPAGGGLIWADPNYVKNVGPGANDPTGQATYFQCCVTNQLVPSNKPNIAPRVGFAWRPLTTDRLVVRGGYGIFYDKYMRFYDGTNYDDNSLNTTRSNPNYPTATGYETASPLAVSGLWLPPITYNPNVTLPPGWLFGVQTEWPQNKTPYNQQWSLDLQYALTPSMLLDVGYVGSHALHEPIQWHFNEGYAPPVAGDPCNFLRDISQATGGNASCLTDPNFVPISRRQPYTNFSTRSYANANILSSSYHSMQVKFEKRFTHGLQTLVNYTWSKALDVNSEIAVLTGAANFVQNAHNLRGDWGAANFDVKHRLVISYLYEIPVGKGRQWSFGRANWALGGWNTSGIITFGSGLPFTTYCCSRRPDQFGNAFGDRTRPNRNGDPTANFQQSVLQWFNPSVFSTPLDGTYGTAGRNILRAPGQHQGDITFSKDFPIGERHKFSYRLEIFNVFSSWHTGQVFPNNRLNASPVGCVLGPGPTASQGNCVFGSLVPLNGLGELNLWNPRIIQMALRYSF